uniref:Uncharacterized protein n=1 Tax=Timema douglasi TaxID=61478 RepID=A0A7R8Z7L7_TIMDO|nr:unnamed protein product [Timema douglasi]
MKLMLNFYISNQVDLHDEGACTIAELASPSIDPSGGEGEPPDHILFPPSGFSCTPHSPHHSTSLITILKLADLDIPQARKVQRSHHALSSTGSGRQPNTLDFHGNIEQAVSGWNDTECLAMTELSEALDFVLNNTTCSEANNYIEVKQELSSHFKIKNKTAIKAQLNTLEIKDLDECSVSVKTTQRFSLYGQIAVWFPPGRISCDRELERGADLAHVPDSHRCPSHESGCVAASPCVLFDGERSRSDLAKLGEVVPKVCLVEHLMLCEASRSAPQKDWEEK